MPSLLGDNIEVVIPTKHIIPYNEIALETAKKSPCMRRKYGAVIASLSNDIFYTAAANYGVSTCCQGNICARDRFEIPHGQRVEVGGEIHAEQSAFIRWTGYDQRDTRWIFTLAGWKDGKELYGKDCYPCHICALMIKHAGFRHIYIKDENREITPVAINTVIEYRELQWETDV